LTLIARAALCLPPSELRLVGLDALVLHMTAVWVAELLVSV
jgi:hypothetical protein